MNVENFGESSSLYLSTGTVGGTTTSTLVKTGIGRLCGIMVSLASTSPTITVYDSTTASGTILLREFIPATATNYQFPMPVLFQTGLFLATTGTVVATTLYY